MRRIAITTTALLLAVGLVATGMAVAQQAEPTPESVSGAAPDAVTFNGLLTEDGDAVADGPHTVTFRVYSTATGGTPMWEEQRSVTTSNGRFTTVLGTADDLGDIFVTSPLYLAAQLQGRPEMTPRQPIGSTPFAIQSAHAPCNLELRIYARDMNFEVSERCLSFDSIPGGYSGDTSIAIGADGLPVVVGFSNAGLVFTRCADLECSTTSAPVVLEDERGGGHNDMIIGSDGLPFIAYYDTVNDDLRTIHCDDPACATFTSSLADHGNDPNPAAFIPGDVGQEPSIAIGEDGLPVIVYRDLTEHSRGAIRIAHCLDVACTVAHGRLVPATGPGLVGGNAVGGNPDVAIDPEGRPVISYSYPFNQRVIFLRCDDAACSSAVSKELKIIPVLETAITIGANGLPYIAYRNDPESPQFFDDEVAMIMCQDADCASTAEVLIQEDAETEEDLGEGLQMITSADGFPVMVYKAYDPNPAVANVTDLIISHCRDELCRRVSTVRVRYDINTTPNWRGGESPNIALAPDGTLVMSHRIASYFSSGIRAGIGVNRCRGC